MTTIWFFFLPTAAYLMANIFLASLALVCTVITTNLYQYNGPMRPPRWLTILSHDYIGRLICIRRVEPEQKESNDEMPINGKHLPNDKERQNEDAEEAGVNASAVATSKEDAENQIKSEWNSIGAVFDRFFFILFLVGTVVLTIGMLIIYPFIGSRLASADPIS